MSKHTVIIKRIDKPGKEPIYMQLSVQAGPASTMLYSSWERASKEWVRYIVKASGHKVILLQDWDGTKDEFLVP